MNPFVKVNINGVDLEILKIGTSIYRYDLLFTISEVFLLKNNEPLYRLVNDDDVTYYASKEETHNNYCQEITNKVIEAGKLLCNESDVIDAEEKTLNLELANKILQSLKGAEGYRNLWEANLMTYNFADLSMSFSNLIVQDDGDINEEVVSQIDNMTHAYLTEENLFTYSVSNDILKESLFVSSFNRTNYEMFMVHYDFLNWLDLKLLNR